MYFLKLILSCLIYFSLFACTTSPPEDIVPVDNFQPNRYMGKWYEIARLDHPFERGLNDISAHYRLLQNGNIEVINKGYDTTKKEWRDITGQAKFISKPSLGSLKVSFFWPFYGGYHIAALDKQNYNWAIVVGPSRKYLWILARQKILAPGLRDLLLKKVSQLNIDISELIWVTQEREDS